ncbi:MAG: glycosyltransferase family 2 protein [Phycisphaerae bacterium]
MGDKAEIAGRRVLVIVPAYNEGPRVHNALDDLKANAPWADVLVVDDGSIDDTAEQARSAGATVVRLPFNLGVGGAMQTGYTYASRHGYEAAVQFDGDGQHCADQIASLVQPVLAGQADLVVGSRLLGEQAYKFPLARWIGSRLLAGMTRLLTGKRVKDTTSGFRAASRRMIAFFALHYPQTYLSDTVEALATAAWHGMVIKETPAKMRMGKTSSITNLLGLIHMIRICVALLIDKIEGKLPIPRPSPAKPGPAK